MDDQDVAILAKLNEGKDVSGNSRKDKLSNCSEDIFEEVMSFFEETCQKLQPFADIDKSPVPSLEEMEQNIDENLSPEAQKWLKLIYPHWMLRKDSKAIMPSIKLRLLDNTSDADDADPYVCFRRREVRQTRKTRGRDAQIVEKLKKLRLELEQSRQLVQFVNQREQLHKQSLETNRKLFEERGKLKKVKQERGIIGEKGEDEELLVNQKVRLPLLTSHLRKCVTDNFHSLLPSPSHARAPPIHVHRRSKYQARSGPASIARLQKTKRRLSRSSSAKPSTSSRRRWIRRSSSTSTGTKVGRIERGNRLHLLQNQQRSDRSGVSCPRPKELRTQLRHPHYRQKARKKMAIRTCQMHPLRHHLHKSPRLEQAHHQNPISSSGQCLEHGLENRLLLMRQ